MNVFNRYLFKRPLRQHVTFDTRQRLVRIIVRLFNQRQLLALRLVQPIFHTVRLFQAFQRQNQQFRVVLVGQGRKGDGAEAPALQPMHGGGVDGDGFLGADVGTVLRGNIIFQYCTVNLKHKRLI